MALSFDMSLVEFIVAVCKNDKPPKNLAWLEQIGAVLTSCEVSLTHSTWCMASFAHAMAQVFAAADLVYFDEDTLPGGTSGGKVSVIRRSKVRLPTCTAALFVSAIVFAQRAASDIVSRADRDAQDKENEERQQQLKVGCLSGAF